LQAISPAPDAHILHRLQAAPTLRPTRPTLNANIQDETNRGL